SVKNQFFALIPNRNSLYPVSFLPDSASAYSSTEHRAYCSQKDEKPTVGTTRPYRRYAGILSVFSYMPPGPVPSPERGRFFSVFPLPGPFPFTASGGACPDAAQQKQALPALFLHQIFFV
ncbi:hypothetical protein, partial [Akkermansia sp.]|uniref:hypothetical protein n=1 Tax=Akkermansia sp. TaxID=1872421 RepID=UPI003AEFE98A